MLTQEMINETMRPLGGKGATIEELNERVAKLESELSHVRQIERLRAALEQIVSECSREATLKLQIAITCERIARAALSN
jgi:predicted RNase H-like nuclease (RuvC/YqgF family)